MKEIINKIQGDFFSILIPGFYLLVALITILLSFSNDQFNLIFCSWDELKKLCHNWNSYWPLYFFLFFIAYLLGHILRAFPVKKADKICKNLFFWTTTKNSLDRIYYTTNFPYHKALSRVLSNLQDNQNNIISKEIFSLPEKKNLHSAFNFFKATLCAESTSSFLYTQTFEARVRLFAGIFWSGCCSILLYLFFGIYAIHSNDGSWTLFHSCFLTVSIIITLLIGMQLPRVRGQEVEYVFLSYLSYVVNKPNIGNVLFKLQNI